MKSEEGVASPGYFLHNGFSGSSYGTPSDPQRVSEADAVRLMTLAGLTAEQVSTTFPPAQYAENGDALFKMTNSNRFVFFVDHRECMDVNAAKVAEALDIAWGQLGGDSTESEG